MTNPIFAFDELQRIQTGTNSGKTYVLDTNVLMEQPYAAWLLSGNGFPDIAEQEIHEKRLELQGKSFDNSPNTVIIPRIVLDELDKKKADIRDPDSAFKARLAAKALEELVGNELIPLAGWRESNVNYFQDDVSIGDLPALYKSFNPLNSVHKYNAAVKLDNDATVMFVDIPYNPALRDSRLCSNDDYILDTVSELNTGEASAIFVSNDRNARTKGTIRGVEVEAFNHIASFDPNQLYSSVSPVAQSFFGLDIMDRLRCGDDVNFSFDDLRKKLHNQLVRPVHIFGVCESSGTKDDISDYIIAKKNTSDPTKMNLQLYNPDLQFMNRLRQHNKKVSAKIQQIDSPLASFDPSEKGAFSKLKNLLNQNKSHWPKDDKGVKRLISNIGKIKANTNSSRILNLYDELISTSDKFEHLATSIDHGANEKLGNIIAVNELYEPSLNQIPYVATLFDRQIDLVTACGPAGTAKTYYALLAGLIQVQEGFYDKIMYIRPLVAAGESLGFYKGTKDEKMSHWMKPADMSLLSAMGKNGYEKSEFSEKIRSENMLSLLKKKGFVEYEVLTEMRGTTLNRTYTVFDEAQSATVNQFRMVVGRMGKGSKLVSTGDFDQIDETGSRDFYSGLAVGIETLSDKDKVAHIDLPQATVVRSYLAGLAGNIRR